MRYLFFVLPFFSLAVFGQNSEIANYKIEFSLDKENKVIQAQEELTWTNTSPIEIDELQFHLYMNAFRDKNSTFMKESGGILRKNVFQEEESGNIYITSIKSSRGEELLGGLNYIQTDDENEKDRTVISLPLEQSLQPGEQIILEIGFRVKLPKIFARTGFGIKDYFLLGQWFPKIGVFEENEDGNWAWNCHQFHANSEFYADFGNYEVTISLPDNLIVAATGSQVGESQHLDGLKIVTFKAKNVHDFAMAISPDFVVFEQKWKHVSLKSYMQPVHQNQHKRYFESAIRTLAYFEKLFGPYPYQTLSIIDPPSLLDASGGMEYPALITAGTYWGIGSWFKYPELVTAHEVGHQYLQGILATNEFEQAFMDEGFNQYMEGRIMDDWYKEGAVLDLFGLTIGDLEVSRYSYVSMSFPEMTKINQNSWAFPKGLYANMSYGKTATALATFENLIGRSKMNDIFKAYYQKWKFKHPKFNDFKQVAHEVLEVNYDWFFDQAFDKNYSCDYKVDTLWNGNTNSTFVLARDGDFIIPQEVLVTFIDDSSISFNWDARENKKTFKYKKEIKSVRIDPDMINLLDLNLINNSYTSEPSSRFFVKYTSKALFWMQYLISHFIFWMS